MNEKNKRSSTGPNAINNNNTNKTKRSIKKEVECK